MICLTFDTDHLDDARLTEFLAAHRIPGKATFFCTRQFAVLGSTDHEMAPHPLLEAGTDWTAVLQTMRRMFPAATGWRSHSCVFSHLLARWLGENGYCYASTEERFGQVGIRPTRHPMGTVWQLPIYYMDTFDISRQVFWTGSENHPFDKKLISRALGAEGIHVFDFHPVHVMLNTPHPEFYLSARERFRAGEAIQQLRYQGYGVGTFLQELCDQMRAAGAPSLGIAEALALYINSSAHNPG